MPKEGLSLLVTLKDGASPGLTTLADKTKALDKESQALQMTTERLAKANDGLMKKQSQLKSETFLAGKEVDRLTKAYNEYGDEMMKLDLDQAIENHAKLKNELMQVEAQLKSNRKAYEENLSAIRKGGLSGDGDISASLGEQMGAVLGKLGIGQQLSQLAQQAGESVLGSAFGDEVGSALGSALSGAISGAALGSAIGGPLGTAVGAALGGATGLASGGIQVAQAQDDAFKDYYGGLYEDVSARSDETVESGSTIAGGREQTRMAFTKRFGSEEDANVYLRKVEKMAAETNYDYDEIVGYTKLLLNSYDPDAVFDVLRSLSDASAGLDLNSSDVNMMISGFSKMKNLGKATQEYLGYYRERGIDTDQALVNYYQGQGKNVEKSDIAGMVKEGNVSGEDASAAILAYIQDTFGGLSNDLAGTYDAMVNNLGDINASLEARSGDAYNTLRKEGIQADMDALGGELGEEIGEINAIKGENRARKENLQGQYYRDVVGAVLNGSRGETWDKLDEDQQSTLTSMNEEYTRLKSQYEESGKTDAEAGAQLEALYEEAEALAQSYFDNSEFVKMLNDTELDEIQAILDNTAGLTEATQAAYNLAQQLSKGLVASVSFSENKALVMDAASAAARGDYEGALSMLTGGGDADGAGKTLTGSKSHAYGLNRVPFDDYPALLHEGERVLTAREAREQDRTELPPLIMQPPLSLSEHPPVAYGDTPPFRGGMGPETGTPPERSGGLSVAISGNTFVGATEEMADQLWEIIMRKIEVAWNAAGR